MTRKTPAKGILVQQENKQVAPHGGHMLPKNEFLRSPRL